MRSDRAEKMRSKSIYWARTSLENRTLKDDSCYLCRMCVHSCATDRGRLCIDTNTDPYIQVWWWWRVFRTVCKNSMPTTRLKVTTREKSRMRERCCVGLPWHVLFWCMGLRPWGRGGLGLRTVGNWGILGLRGIAVARAWRPTGKQRGSSVGREINWFQAGGALWGRRRHGEKGRWRRRPWQAELGVLEHRYCWRLVQKLGDVNRWGLELSPKRAGRGPQIRAPTGYEARVG